MKQLIVATRALCGALAVPALAIANSTWPVSYTHRSFRKQMTTDSCTGRGGMRGRIGVAG